MPPRKKNTTVAASSFSMFVRLKPFNARRGLLLRKYTHLPSGKKFEESLGWCRVDALLAEQLREIHQNPRDDDTPFAFDVCTEAEAREIDKSERKAKERRNSEDAHDLTTSALRTPEPTPVEERLAARSKRTAPRGSARSALAR